MAKLPYYKSFAADDETDEWFCSLTDQIRGYYWRLKNHAWINGSIPASSTTRCRVFGVHPKTDQAAFKELSRKFQEDPMDASRLLHEGLQEQVKEASRRSASAAESVKHRYERSTAEKETVDRHARARADSDSVPESSFEVKEKTSLQKSTPPIGTALAHSRFAETDGWSEWWEAWSSVRGTSCEDKAARAYISVNTSANMAEIMGCTLSYLASGKCDDGHGFNPDNFLFEQNRTGFKARWPPKKQSPKSESLVDRTMALVQRRIAEGRSPL